MFRVAVPVLHPFLVVSSPFHISLLFLQYFTQPVILISWEKKPVDSSQGKRWFTIYISYFHLLKFSAGKNHSIKHLLFYLEDTIPARRALITVIDPHIECEEN